MLADDNNLFFTHKDIRYLLHIVSQELEKINQWLISNKLSLSLKKKYSFFQKENINKQLRNTTNRINYLLRWKGGGRGLWNENLSWNKHVKYNENKIAKDLRLLYRAKHYLNKKSLLVLYCSIIHTYINYGNLAWGSNNRTNL